MSTYEELTSRLRSGAREVVVAAAHELGGLRDERAFAPLLELLEQTTDPALRDAAAIGLCELGDARALTPLLALIADPKTEGHRGTLVYALGGFDCTGILPSLVELVIDGKFEVSRQAFSVIESIEGEIPTSIWESSRVRLRAAIPVADPDKRALLEELVALFDDSDG